MTQTPRERVLQELRQRIDKSAYRPGDRLPPERELARQLDVSRTVLRGALAVLEAEGAIWRGVGQGTFVGTPSIDGPDRIQAIRDLTSPAEVMEVRIALEPELAALAAHRASGNELDEVERCCDKAAAAQTQQTYELWDGRFHHAIASAGHNRLFVALFEAMNAVRDHTTWGQVREAKRSQAWQQETTKQHLAILAALRERDAARARERMVAHLQAVKHQLLDSGRVATSDTAA